MKIVRIVFLGTSGAVSSTNRDNTSLLIDNILIDCPGNVFGKLLKAGCDPVQTVDHLIITHRHIDHVYGLPSFLEMIRLSGRKKPLYVYILREYFDFLEKFLSLFDLFEEKLGFTLQVVPISERQQVINTDFITVECFPVCHSIKNIGLKISSHDALVVYTSDTQPCETIVDFAKQATVLIHEATCSELLTGPKEGHSTVEDAARMAQQAGVKMLCLVHLGNELDGQEENLVQSARKHFSGEILVPKDFDKLVV
ncbi:MBL fold metallo-hydrolase [Pseudothermotoga thermarum]|uniref:Beta-lactamase domain-containing protein n=1 Tax=Pseudothermotoga thermarum DSM 5069 TaxID=688269 RepID=F7YTG9_9THEM|nr:MBL fold metallo-hydrolase [Pseudothermotoga thermarum]AEH51183.1 beta-lactamase domain-containing protein [Pseudothermotoga thermarum DSM 5069]